MRCVFVHASQFSATRVPCFFLFFFSDPSKRERETTELLLHNDHYVLMPAEFPTIPLTEEFMKMLGTTDEKAIYALKPVFATRCERLSSTNKLLERAVLISQSGCLYVIDTADGRITHTVELGDKRNLDWTISVAADKEKDKQTQTQGVKIIIDKSNDRNQFTGEDDEDPLDVLCLQFHCSRAPVAVNFVGMLRHFVAIKGLKQGFDLQLADGDESVMEETRRERSGIGKMFSNSFSAARKSSIFGSPEKRSNSVAAVAKKKKKEVEKRGEVITVPPPAHVPSVKEQKQKEKEEKARKKREAEEAIARAAAEEADRQRRASEEETNKQNRADDLHEAVRQRHAESNPRANDELDYDSDDTVARRKHEAAASRPDDEDRDAHSVLIEEDTGGYSLTAVETPGFHENTTRSPGATAPSEQQSVVASEVKSEQQTAPVSPEAAGESMGDILRRIRDVKKSGAQEDPTYPGIQQVESVAFPGGNDDDDEQEEEEHFAHDDAEEYDDDKEADDDEDANGDPTEEDLFVDALSPKEAQEVVAGIIHSIEALKEEQARLLLERETVAKTLRDVSSVSLTAEHALGLAQLVWNICDVKLVRYFCR